MRQRINKNKALRKGIAICVAAAMVTAPGAAAAQDGTPVAPPARSIDTIEALPVVSLGATRPGLPRDLGPGAMIMDLAVGKTVSVPLNRPAKDIIVANPEVADVIVKGPTQVYLLGRSPGATNVFVLGENGTVLTDLQVNVGADLEGARRMLRSLMPDARIELTSVGGAVLMQGYVESARDAAEAQEIVQSFLGISAGGEGGGGGERAAGPMRVINALRVAGEQQVLLQVQVAEIQRSTLKRLGFNTTFSADDIAGFQPGTNNGTRPPLVTGSGSNILPGIGQWGTFFEGSINIFRWGIGQTTFRTLEDQGLIKVLAEPSLTAISGETANFLAGGEIPLPVPSDDGIQIEWRPFGVSLSFTPLVLGNDLLSLRVSTEVSRLSPETGIDIPLVTGPASVPGLIVRRAQSTVTLPSGASLMIAGMLQNEEVNSVAGVPGMKDVPILGALFRSVDFQTNLTELVVIVKAFTVRPVDFAAQLALPTDGFVPANDHDMYVLGRLYSRHGRAAGGDAITVAAPMGYIME